MKKNLQVSILGILALTWNIDLHAQNQSQAQTNNPFLKDQAASTEMIKSKSSNVKKLRAKKTIDKDSENFLNDQSLTDQVIRILQRDSNLIGFADQSNEPDGQTDEELSRKEDLQNRIQENGANSLSAAIGFDNLAIAQKRSGHLFEAEENSKKCLKILIKSRGFFNKDTAISLDNLQCIYLSVQNYIDALPLALKAEQIFEHLGTDFIKDKGINKENIACSMLYLGEFDSGIDKLKQAFEIYDEIGGPPSNSMYYLDMGWFYIEKNDGETAEKYLRDGIIHKMRTMEPGEDRENIVSTIKYALAKSLSLQGKYNEAEKIVDLEKDKNVDPSQANNPGAGENRCIAAEIQQGKGRYANAIRYYQSGLAQMKRLLPPTNLHIFQEETQYIVSLSRNGDTKVAKETAETWKKAAYDNIKSVLTCGTENQRISFLQKNISFDIPGTLFTTEQLANCIINWKGIILDSILQEKKAIQSLKDSAKNEELAELTRLKGLLMCLDISSEFKSSPNEIHQKNNLLEKKESLERSLFTKTRDSYSAYSFGKLTYSDIQRTLSQGDALVEMFDYLPLSKTSVDLEYVALIITPDGPPQRVELGDAQRLNEKVNRLRSMIVGIDSNSEISFAEASADLHASLWKPIESVLPTGVKNIILSPSGSINYLSFASLTDAAGNFVSEKYKISYVSSSRDLLTRVKKIDATRSIAIFDNPDFSISGSFSQDVFTSQITRGTSFIDLSSVSFPPLPGSLMEGNLISAIGKTNNWAVKEYTGVNASKINLMSIESPNILHLATHGFYLGDNQTNSGGNRGMMLTGTTPENHTNSGNLNLHGKAFYQNPMRESGLALAGAQDTMRSWGRGIVPDPSNNGILTAEEVALLNLNSTWLVSLSACETGVGATRSGEGVFGLRRAFKMAGAQNLLMTLWTVSDETTVSLMADFYKEAIATHDAAGSLAKVQSDWLVKLRKEKGLLVAVRDAGPFAMVVMANPNVKSLPEALPTAAISETPSVSESPSPAKSSDQISTNGSPTSEPSSSDKTTTSVPESQTPQLQAGTAKGSEGHVLEFDEALRRADEGDGYAQGVVSIYYGMGYKTKKDVSRSASYALKSAAQGNPLGIYRVGVMRSNGDGMQKNTDQGQTLKRKSFSGLNSMIGDPYALNILGVLAYTGDGVSQDTNEALRLYKLSADLGYAPAQYNYASLILDGGAPGDRDEAQTYKSKAAEQNFQPSL